MEDLEEKGAFITGAASGIGLAIAIACAEAGMKVMLADIDRVQLDHVIDDLGDRYSVMATVCDVSDPASMAAAAARTFAEMGNVHLLVNNAGVAVGGPLHEISLTDWDWILGVNLKGVVHGLHYFLPHMLEHGEGGHVVNTASLAGMVAPANMGPYNATKFAVVAMSETLREELAPRGIGVSVLCPAFVRTRIHESGRNRQAAYGGPKERATTPEAAQMAAVIEAGMEPEAIADAVMSAVEDERFYIFTHKEAAPAVRERLAAISAALDE